MFSASLGVLVVVTGLPVMIHLVLATLPVTVSLFILTIVLVVGRFKVIVCMESRTDLGLRLISFLQAAWSQ